MECKAELEYGFVYLFPIFPIVKNYDFLIVGAGIFGVCTSLELRSQGHSVCLINPGVIPHPLAASTDISKVIRMEYGRDSEYMHMAIQSMDQWRKWNEVFNDPLYHEVGYLLLSKSIIDAEGDSYESASLAQVMRSGHKPEIITREVLKERFPAFNAQAYYEGYYHQHGGFAESGRAVSVLTAFALDQGVDVLEDTAMTALLKSGSTVTGILTNKDERLVAKEVILCTGNFTPYLLPELAPFMKITGHPVFHLKPSDAQLFLPKVFPVFAADISNTGWYGFPLHPKEKVVKVARHSEGLVIDPEHDERIVYEDDIAALRQFLKLSIPALAQAPIVYTRRCCYTDSLDGHFWIDRHPELEGLTVGTGGSGHGFKMGPEVGKMIAARALGQPHGWSDRYDWRQLESHTDQCEEARFLINRRLQ